MHVRVCVCVGFCAEQPGAAWGSLDQYGAALSSLGQLGAAWGNLDALVQLGAAWGSLEQQPGAALSSLEHWSSLEQPGATCGGME